MTQYQASVCINKNTPAEGSQCCHNISLNEQNKLEITKYYLNDRSFLKQRQIFGEKKSIAHKTAMANGF